MKKTFLLFALVMLSSIGVWAENDIDVDGVLYDITSENTVNVGDNSAYKGNPDLVIPAKVTYGGKEYSVTGFCSRGSFFGNKKLTSVTIPNTITVIKDNTFTGCDNLKSVKLPNTITHIGNSAFSGCTSLTSFTIPASVTEITMSAFNKCTSMEYVIFEGETPPDPNGADIFYECNAVILVPGSSLSSYKSTWSAYADYISPIEVIDIARKMALGTLVEEQAGPSIKVTDQNDNVIILYNPKNVKFVK